jgi:hypothetical protein
MADYLEEAAQILRKARDANEREAGERFMDEVVRERRMEIAAAFTRLAAIERGLLPPEMEVGEK